MGFKVKFEPKKLKCPDEAKEERDSEREAPSVTERSFVITSRVLLSPPFDDLLDEVVSNVSLVLSTKRPEVSSRFSSRTLSVMLSPTPSTPSERLSPPSTSSTLSSDRAELFTDSVDKSYEANSLNRPFLGPQTLKCFFCRKTCF